MEKYLLVTCQEREICTEVFDSFREAWFAMFKAFKSCPDWEEWKENFKLGEETTEYGVNKENAWANADDGDMNIDWEIFKVDKPYNLISVYEREIFLTSFDTIAEAQAAMLNKFKSCSDWEEWEPDFELGEDTGEYYVGETSAYANDEGGDSNCDWLIETIDLESTKISEELVEFGFDTGLISLGNMEGTLCAFINEYYFYFGAENGQSVTDFIYSNLISMITKVLNEELREDDDVDNDNNTEFLYYRACLLENLEKHTNMLGKEPTEKDCFVIETQSEKTNLFVVFYSEKYYEDCLYVLNAINQNKFVQAVNYLINVKEKYNEFTWIPDDFLKSDRLFTHIDDEWTNIFYNICKFVENEETLDMLLEDKNVINKITIKM